MRLLDRYLVGELLVPLGACLACFLMFWVGFDVISRVGDFQREGLHLSDVLEYYWVSLPELLLTVMPVGLLLALLYALTNLARHQELTAMRAAGLSLWRLTFPYLIIGVAVSALLYCLNDVWFPDGADRAQAIRRRRTASTNDTGWISRVNFANESAQRYWNISAFRPASSELRIPSFREPLSPEAFRVITAASGRWTNGAWRFEHTQEFIHRHADDPAPGTKGEVYVGTPEFVTPPAELATWPGTDTVITNVLWRTNLVQEVAGGQRWRIGGFCLTNEELVDITLRLPVGAGAQRAVGALSGIWTNDMWRFLSAREWLYRQENDPDPMVVPLAGAVPELDLPHLTETPGLILSELKISTLNLSRAMRRPQLSVREILDYRRLHPQIRPQLAALLNTQLHARVAAPWTCLVVVLIAVPFGAPSGRRNIFYGVAGSIAIAFSYFVLQRLGYALAQNGQLEPWLGAWFPNLFFGIAGAVLISRVR